MYLKGALCRTHDEFQRRQLGHRLKKIWKRFKAENPDLALNKFDQCVSELDKYERIRYYKFFARNAGGSIYGGAEKVGGAV
jgi:hypothetical protein